jgi:formylglycine-generating enzyme required for sulfatase activity
VGLFPRGRGPYGAEDMAGNVWEWTRSRWGACTSTPEFGYPYRSGDGREDPRGRGLWVLRGGSYFNNKYVVRCACRSGNLPVNWDINIGFRVVFSLAGS